MRRMRVWAIGISGPPARPCSTRNATSICSDVATPHKIENRVKPMMAVRNIRTTPKRDASQPDSGTVKASATA